MKTLLKDLKGYNITKDKIYIYTNNLIIYYKEVKTVRITQVVDWLTKCYEMGKKVEKYPILIVKTPRKPALVYFSSADGELTSLSYDTWKSQALILEKQKVNFKEEKKEVPNYIG